MDLMRNMRWEGELVRREAQWSSKVGESSSLLEPRPASVERVPEKLAAVGDKVALLARGEKGLKAAAAEIERDGGTALVVPVDMAEPASVMAAADEVERHLGPIEVWVNCAFTSVFAKFMDIKLEKLRVTDVNSHGYVYGTRAALERMLPRDHGVVVQVGSALAYRGIPLQSAYSGSKHAMQGFHEALRAELLHDRSHVHVTMVQMPAVNTPQFSWVLSRLPHQAQPVPPIYQPEVAARAILHAADHPRRREYWVGGSTAATLAANALAPGLFDRYLARTGPKSQQTGRPRDPDQPANIWHPADGREGRDFGAHGIFDDRSMDTSFQLGLPAPRRDGRGCRRRRGPRHPRHALGPPQEGRLIRTRALDKATPARLAFGLCAWLTMNGKCGRICHPAPTGGPT